VWHLDLEATANDSQVPTAVSRPVIGIEALGNAVTPDGLLQLGDKHLNVLTKKDAGPDDITGGIVHDRVDIGFPFLFVMVDSRTMKEIGYPKAAKFTENETAAIIRGGVLPSQTCHTAKPIKSGHAGLSTIPDHFLQQSSEER
jgi:hypothetical protein